MPALSRFAPSPTGLLHVGHAYAMMQLEAWAAQHHGNLLLRIEDIDRQRCRPEFIPKLLEDVAWFGMPCAASSVRQQSQHLDDYQQAIASLKALGVLYPCFCTRSSTAYLPNGHYAGRCRQLSEYEQEQRIQYEAHAWRLHVAQAKQYLGQELIWQEDGQWMHHDVDCLDDVVLVRKDIATSYHLAVVVDDALQGITHVVRGDDLRDSTPIHVALQTLLGLPTPHYQHHPLLRYPNGQRLAKSRQSTSLQSLRQAGLSAADVRDVLAHCHGVWQDAMT